MRFSASVTAVLSVVAGVGQAAEPVDFARDIRPVLSDRCFHCHGPDANKREGELRLDQAPKDDRQIVVKGHPEKSALWERITSNDPDLRMPPIDAEYMAGARACTMEPAIRSAST